MNRKAVALLLGTLISIAVLAVSCGTSPSTTTTTQTTTVGPTTSTGPPSTTVVAPQYGGRMIRVLPFGDPTSWGPFPGAGATPQQLQELWAGDWTLGNAGGYGKGITDWAQTVDRFDHKVGLIAEKTTWSVDSSTDIATIVYTIRQGIHYQKVPQSAAAALVNGRELTADDVVFDMQQRISDTASYVYLSNPDLRKAEISKTGPWEVSVKIASSSLLTAINRFGSTSGYYPPEVFQKFNKMAGWKDQVGTAAFMLTDYVGGSSVTYSRNPDYWETDPIGPGKGNQLPYVDTMVTLIIPDTSTRLAGLRTGKIDTITGVIASDAEPLMKGVPELKVLEKTSVDGRGTPIFMRVDKAPFTDVRVRRAMMMGIDFNTILKEYWGGKGQILNYPFADMIDYHDLYLGINDPDTPDTVKELFVYSPDKAKDLLKQAGFPNGFETTILLNASDLAAADYYSIVKDMWSKIGINLTLDIKENTVYAGLQASRTYVMTTGTTAPAATFYLGVAYQGTGQNANLGNLNDPVVNAALRDVNVAALTDLVKAMQLWREKLAKYVVDQAFAITNVTGYNYNLWWPWLANYSGEGPVSYAQTTWPNYVWYDQALKRSMGH